MGGGSMTMAIKALQMFIQSLPEDSMFNILSYGCNHDYLFSGSVKYDQDNLEKALEEVGTFSANYGGTEIFKPLKEVLSTKQANNKLKK